MGRRAGAMVGDTGAVRIYSPIEICRELVSYHPW
jgi:hypothetical protein